MPFFTVIVSPAFGGSFFAAAYAGVDMQLISRQTTSIWDKQQVSFFNIKNSFLGRRKCGAPFY